LKDGKAASQALIYSVRIRERHRHGTAFTPLLLGGFVWVLLSRQFSGMLLKRISLPQVFTEPSQFGQSGLALE